MLRRLYFWKYGRLSIFSYLFAPISLLYSFLVSKRLKQTSISVNSKVICVGNILMGGTGKTPVAIEIANFYKKNGKNVQFITRGYGGKIKESTLVNLHHTYKDVGDEALLLFKHAPTWVGINRLKSAQMAEKNGAEIIIMDDGFQYPYLKKDLSIVVVEGKYGFGNCKVFPSGPLREPLFSGLKRASSVLIVGKPFKELTSLLEIFKVKYQVSQINAINSSLKGNKVVAFAGIGNPEKFFNTLKDEGAEIVKTFSYPDHYVFKEHQIKKMIKISKEYGVKLITTEKDFTRIDNKYKNDISFLEIKLKIDNIDNLMENL